MSKQYIENEVLKVEVAAHGAELSSVYDKENQLERVWCADPAVWNRHAPILFPFVGKVKDKEYTYQGKTYEMKTQHGFGRDSVFTCVEKTDASVTYSLVSTEETKKIYPFDFDFKVTHTLDAENPRILHIIWEVENKGNGDMYFKVGGHPGFMVPVDAEGNATETYLEFPGKETFTLTLLNLQTGYATPWNTKELKLEDGFCKVHKELFDIDTLIMDNGQVEVSRICKADKTPYVTMVSKGFTSFGVWAKDISKFICLEPWAGRSDNEDAPAELTEKDGIQKLEAGKSGKWEYTVEFHK